MACEARRKCVRTNSAGESVVSVTSMEEERGGMGVRSAAEEGSAVLVGNDRRVSIFGIVINQLLCKVG